MTRKPLKRVLLSGGGTGGHIYPALALAEEFKKQNPGVKIKFVGSQRGLESKIIPDKGYELYKLNIGPLHSSVGRKEQVKTLLTLPFVFLHCLWILISFRPQRVMGFGGYASGPIVFIASICFFKTAVWEANVQPGIANKLLSKVVKRCYVVFEESLKFFPNDKTKCFGYPVRHEFDVRFEEKMKAQRLSVVTETNVFNSTQNEKNMNSSLKVLVFGGSQGAKVLNELIPKVAQENPEIQFTLQTGLKNFDSTIKSLEQLKTMHKNQDNKSKNQLHHSGLTKIENIIPNLTVLPFLDPIIDFYLSSDVIICRSGAGALAELAAIGSNCLFVPFALASDNHQYRNALALSQRGAAGLIEEKHLSVQTVSDFLNSFRRKSEAEQRQISQKMLAFFKPKATFNMVEDFTNI